VKISQERKENVLKKMLPPYNMSVSKLVEEEGIGKTLLYKWRSELIAGGKLMTDNKLGGSKLSSQAKFSIVLETSLLNEHDLSAYCREKGLYVSQVKEWRDSCEKANNPKAKTVKAAELKSYKQRLKQLERELNRKDKALAETTALLVLRKKLNALLDLDNEED